MSARFVRNQGNVNLVHEFEEDSELPVTTVEDAAHLLWNEGAGDHSVAFEDLEEEDWLIISHNHLKQVYMSLALRYQRNLSTEAAKAITEAAVEERHGLG